MDPLGDLHDELYNAGIPIFNRHGTYLTPEERADLARKQGLCERCGIKTQKGKLRKQPITDDAVYKGICIRCFPAKVPMNILQKYDDLHPRAPAVVVSVAAAPNPTPGGMGGMMGGMGGMPPGIPPPPSGGGSTSPKPNSRAPALRSSQQRRQLRAPDLSYDRGNHTVGVLGQERPPSASAGRSQSIEDAGPLPLKTNNIRSESNPDTLRSSRGPVASRPSMEDADPAVDDNCVRNDLREDTNAPLSRPPIQPRHHISPQEDYTGGHSGAPTQGEESALKGLRQSHDKPEIIRRYMHRLRNEGGGYDDFNGACMAEVFDLMDLYRSDTRLLSVACGALWRLTLEEEQKLQAAETGVVETIIENIAREQNFDDADFVEWALGCLTSMACVADNKVFIAEKGGIEHVVEALAKLPEVGGVFSWACRCLHTLVTEYEDEDEEDSQMLKGVISKNIIAIHEAQGIQAIVTAMGNANHIRDPSSQRWAIKLLWRLQALPQSMKNRSLKKLHEVGFIATMVKILKSRATTSELFQLCVSFLNWLLSAPAMELETEYAVASECIPTVVRVMAEGEHVGMLACCCMLLATLSSGSREARTIVQESNGAQAIIDALERFPEDETLVEYGIWAMWTMSSGDLFFRNASLLPRANQIIGKAASKHHKSHKVLHPLCGYFGNVCALKTLDTAADIPISLIVNSFSACKDNPDALKEAERGISNLFAKFPKALDPSICQDLNVEQLINDAVSYPDNISKVIGVLSALASQPDARTVMVRSGLVPSLARVLEEKCEQIDDPSLSRNGCITTLSNSMTIMELMASLIGIKGSVSFPENIILNVVRLLDLYVEAEASGSMQPSENDATALSSKEKVCILIRNILISSSSRLKLDGLVDCITNRVIDPPNSTAEMRMEGCAVLWALSAKYASKVSNEKILQKMFGSVLGAISKHKGASPSAPYHVELQKTAAGALCAITNNARNHPFPLDGQQIDELVSLPYTVLDCDPNSNEAFDKLLEIILNLSYLDEVALVQGGVIVVVIDTMAEFEQNSAIQEIGCSILAVLASTENLQVNLSIVQTDGIDMIINALALFPGNAGIETQACKALSHLSIDQESRILISSLGGIMLLGNSMTGNMDNVGLLEGCCTAILNLSSDADDALLLGTNIVDIVVKVMTRHLESSALQENGMGILQNISMRSLEAKRAIADAGGIRAVASAIREHMITPSVLERAFTTLWSLAVLDLNQPVIAQCDGINLVVNGMMTAIMSERVQKQGCGCLCTLSSNSQNKGIIQNIGGVDTIVYAMWAHYSSEEIQIEACRALSSLAVDVHTNEVMIASESEVNAIVSAMRRFPHSERLQEHACVTLRNFLLSADNVDVFRMSESEVRDVVSLAARYFPATCSERANQVLSSLG